jgi:hypothetical protein
MAANPQSISPPVYNLDQLPPDETTRCDAWKKTAWEFYDDKLQLCMYACVFFAVLFIAGFLVISKIF